jgi:hypothetical protein
MPRRYSSAPDKLGAELAGAVSCGAMRDEHQASSTREQSAPNGAAQKLANEIATRPFYAAIADLLPRPIARHALLALFDFRASHGTIKGWRYGRRSPPAWAIELLRSKTEARARAMLANAARLDRARTTLTREQAAPINLRRGQEKARREAGEV